MKKTKSIVTASLLSILATFSSNSFCHGADIPISISRAIDISWLTTTNRGYQLLVATNVAGPYLPTGQIMEGNGKQMETSFPAEDKQQFFKVQDTSASGLTWLEGVWKGVTYQAGLSSESYLTTLTIQNNLRSFSGVYNIPCSTVLTLISYSETQARFSERVLSGPCVSSIIILTKVNSTNVFFCSYTENNPTGSQVFGTLLKQ